MRMNTTMLVGLLAFALTGCAGIGTPIGPRFARGESQTLDKDYYDNPIAVAHARVVEWDDAIQNIQHGNAGAIGSLTAINGALVYRAARNKTGVATALLAAGGMVGMSLSDALIQVSRLGIYENGISAMECAIYAYRGAGGRRRTPQKTLDVYFARVKGLVGKGPLMDDVLAIERKLLVAAGVRTRGRDEAFGRTVSRITHEVHQALIGSIVTLQSRESTWNFGVPESGAPDTIDLSEDAGKVLMALRSASSGSTDRVKRYAGSRGVVAPLLDDAEFTEALTGIFDSLVADLDTTPDPTYLQKLDACSVATPVATARGMTWVPLSVVAVDASDPMNAARSSSAAAVVSGGFPPYKVAIAESGDHGVTASLSTAGGANVVTVAVTTKPKAGDMFTAVVTDAAHATVKLRIKIN